MKVGILGGTFNPIHNGHLQMANYAISHHNLSEVLILPSGEPPHKVNSEIIDSNDRYEMCLLACMENDKLLVESLELDRKGTTYTIDTLRYFTSMYRLKDSLYYIIGGDTVLLLKNWREYENVFKLCKFIAFLRRGYNNEEIIAYAREMENSYGLDIVFDYSEIRDISSTNIRERIQKNLSVKDLVPERIEKYINEHQLYK